LHQGRSRREKLGSLTKCSPDRRSEAALEWKRIRKSSGRCNMTENSPTTSSKEAQSSASTWSTETSGLVPVMVATNAR
jgi:hypothetical protein